LSQGRVMSIDALRGFDMFWIVGGGTIFRNLRQIYPHPVTEWISQQLTHAEWEGFRPWDLIMPLFLFVVGVVMPFSFNKRLARGDSKKDLYIHIITRTIILFVLGMVAQGNLLEFKLSKLHIYCNTLQAIAAGYLIASLVMLNMPVILQAVTTAALLLLFWALMVLVAVPGHEAGVLTPQGNLAIYIDRLILGRFQDGTTYTWILSSMTFACTVLLGVMAGHLLRAPKSEKTRFLWLLAAGIGCLTLGTIWSRWFPIIKHLWTSSFVLYSAGLCYLLLALFYLIIEIGGLESWAFGFVVLGMNAITVYMLTRIIDFHWVAGRFVGGLAQHCGPWNRFVYDVTAFIIVWLIMWYMYRKKTFLKI